jgi:hypothetical protein
MSTEPVTYWIVFDGATDVPMYVTKSIGTYSCLWHDPISAYQYRDSLAGSKDMYYVRKVSLLLGERA